MQGMALDVPIKVQTTCGGLALFDISWGVSQFDSMPQDHLSVLIINYGLASTGASYRVSGVPQR